MVDRRVEEIRCAAFQRPQAQFALIANGDHHDRHAGRMRQPAKARDEFLAVHLRHIVIGDDEVRPVAPQPFQRLGRVGEGADSDPFIDRQGELGVNRPVGGPVINNHDQRHNKTWPISTGTSSEVFCLDTCRNDDRQKRS